VAPASPGEAVSAGAAAAGAAPTAERRLVSVLFADLVGFTPFAEERDSEDVRLGEGAEEYADLGNTRELLQIKSQQARQLMLTVQFAPVIPLTDEVLAAAEHGDHLLIIADTLVTRGTALCNLLRWREGIAVLDAALEMANANGLTSTWFRGVNNTLGWRGAIDPNGAMEMAVAGLAVARRLGDERWTQGLSGQIGYLGIRTGDWDNVVLDLERALATTIDPRTRANPVDNLASIRAARGESVDEQVKELKATYELDPTVSSKVLMLDAIGWQHFGAGRLDEARDTWTNVLELDPSSANGLAQFLARVAIRLNDAEAATTGSVFTGRTFPMGARPRATIWPCRRPSRGSVAIGAPPRGTFARPSVATASSGSTSTKRSWRSTWCMSSDRRTRWRSTSWLAHARPLPRTAREPTWTCSRLPSRRARTGPRARDRQVVPIERQASRHPRPDEVVSRHAEAR
jgi:tetratricopeptide (TPR) repeat protein